MSNEVVGIVEEVNNNGKGKGSNIRVHGLKYGAYDPVDAGLDEVSVGTTVSFRFKEKDGGGGITYKNILGKVTTVKDGTPLTAAPAASGSAPKSGFRKNGEAGGFPIHARAYERALDRRNALNAAVSYVAGGASVVTPEELIDIAKKFETYSTGDDIAMAEAALSFKEDSTD